MAKFKTIVKKTWVFIAAATLIVGSNSLMVSALNRNIPESASAYVVLDTNNNTAYSKNQTAETEDTVEYSVVDLSKRVHDGAHENAIKDKLSYIKDITPEQIEEKYNATIANMIPGEKDISAEQAASYAVAVLEKAYGVDLTGYTAEASFSRSPVPNSDIWGITFLSPNEAESSKSYHVSVDSVSGTIIHVGFYNLNSRDDNNKDLESPEWKNKAVQEILKLIPENVTISSSKVVFSDPQTGVTVVSELSDGSAYAVRLIGENKEVAVIIYFPDGYDGSFDPKPLTDKAVG
ncbi:hypothetical protein Amet_4731 [Alkaliphilus metalliredigens QYMF]|uniref:PepSY domain-containing protein n=1 Tax=Alkaliphilus metalliredigens (strain QYMF) TaxID=293826 RepID=A6TX81_ALKMQ|nr:hypothetical protein [Alkaliphilus metalliredigens]ABR50799.1 hypothetical protein Amet_4731 [Alkaliphilus metalliredigens QYMF]